MYQSIDRSPSTRLSRASYIDNSTGWDKLDIPLFSTGETLEEI